MKLVLSPEAARDLGDIHDFTADRWGDKQAQSYLRRLHAACVDLAANPDKGRRRSDVPPPYRVLTVDSHLVIYRTVDDRVEMLNVLHPAMDLAARLRAALAGQVGKP
ncbi:hypothetical protein IP88_09900 [alpha proteobacterium AAP81b]|nr:hypothetical protein IP88_09900 [alpha proteobacterium AAP81b]